jgi:hypothetical protein
MKKLIELDKQVAILDEAMIVPGMKLPTYRGLLKNILNQTSPKNNEESAVMGQLLLKLRVAEPILEIDNDDFKLILAKMDLNEGKMYAGFHSQLLSWLREIEKMGDLKVI